MAGSCPANNPAEAYARAVAAWTRSWCASAVVSWFHAGSACFTLGLLGAIYFRGLFTGYLAGWESTWLDARGVSAFLEILLCLLCPASRITGIPLPGSNEGVGAPAAHALPRGRSRRAMDSSLRGHPVRMDRPAALGARPGVRDSLRPQARHATALDAQGSPTCGGRSPSPNKAPISASPCCPSVSKTPRPTGRSWKPSFAKSSTISIRTAAFRRKAQGGATGVARCPDFRQF